MARIRSTLLLASTFGLVLLSTAGCPDSGAADPTAHLKGTVTLGGGPIPADTQASISFGPTALGQARTSSSSIKNGHFDVRDAPKGKVIVKVSIMQATGKMVGPPGGRQQEDYKDLVPASKIDGFTIDVTGDKDDLKFDL
jgi:hypothetical protein